MHLVWHQSWYPDSQGRVGLKTPRISADHPLSRTIGDEPASTHFPASLVHRSWSVSRVRKPNDMSNFMLDLSDQLTLYSAYRSSCSTRAR